MCFRYETSVVAVSVDWVTSDASDACFWRVCRGISEPWASLRKRLGLLEYIHSSEHQKTKACGGGGIQEGTSTDNMHIVASPDLPFIPPHPFPYITCVCIYPSG